MGTRILLAAFFSTIVAIIVTAVSTAALLDPELTLATEGMSDILAFFRACAIGLLFGALAFAAAIITLNRRAADRKFVAERSAEAGDDVVRR